MNERLHLFLRLVLRKTDAHRHMNVLTRRRGESFFLELHPDSFRCNSAVLVEISEWQAEGETVAIATVVRASGSSPRPVGAKLAVTQSGRMAGSVSGGCVEGAVFETAMEVLKSGKPQLVHYGISDEMAWDVGLSCGGMIDVFIEPYK